MRTVGGDVGGLYPITAPALILVGSLMARSVRDIEWDRLDEALPAFLVVLGVPLTFSIADGLALGFIAHPLLKLATGRAREEHPLGYVIGALFLLRYTLL